MSLIPWTEITSFHNIKKYTEACPEILNNKSMFTYKCKVKLHGTNAGIQVFSDGKIIAQSRETELINGADNCGFAKWVDSHKEKWKQIVTDDKEYIIYGEWCGKGVKKGVAISEVPNKIFAVFAARLLNSNDSIIIEPNELQDLVKNIPETYVLPWHHSTIYIDWTSNESQLLTITNLINSLVLDVEQTDPWVEATFKIKGVGEGLVFYPVSQEHLSLKDFNNLVFKAKGEAHKNIKTGLPAQVNPQLASNVDGFVDMVLSEARLEQGANQTYDIKLIGKFLAWIALDVQKETKDELEASGLTWEQVNKALTNKARIWYLAKSKNTKVILNEKI